MAKLNLIKSDLDGVKNAKATASRFNAIYNKIAGWITSSLSVDSLEKKSIESKHINHHISRVLIANSYNATNAAVAAGSPICEVHWTPSAGDIYSKIILVGFVWTRSGQGNRVPVSGIVYDNIYIDYKDETNAIWVDRDEYDGITSHYERWWRNGREHLGVDLYLPTVAFSGPIPNSISPIKKYIHQSCGGAPCVVASRVYSEAFYTADSVARTDVLRFGLMGAYPNAFSNGFAKLFAFVEDRGV